MAKWDITCGGFPIVRDLLEDSDGSIESIKEIFEHLTKCIDEIIDKATERLDDDWVFKEEFFDLKREIVELIDCENEDLEEEFGDQFDDVCNNILSDMYDLCNNARVWLPTM